MNLILPTNYPAKILYYAITPGGQNLWLSYLPANTLSLIISFTSVGLLGMLY